MRTVVVSRALPEPPPWTWPWWRPTAGQHMTFIGIVLIHVTAAVGVVLFPLPGWPLFLAAGTLTWVGGLGTTVCYHRTLAHRALRLHPLVRESLIYFAMYHGAGVPLSWTANHRLHHATADTPADISSPRVGAGSGGRTCSSYGKLSTHRRRGTAPILKKLPTAPGLLCRFRCSPFRSSVALRLGVQRSSGWEPSG